MATDSPALALRSVVFGYGAAPVLRGIDLEVRAGEIVVLLGANGVGKSTLLCVTSGLLRQWSGSVELFGQDVSSLSPEARLEAGIFHCPERGGVFDCLSVRENLDIASYSVRSKPEATRRTNEAKALFPRLSERLSQGAGTLSGGERRMLTLAMSMITGARVRLLDEPGLGLAPRTVSEVGQEILRMRNHGCSVLICEQNASWSLRIANRAYVLESGQTLVSGEASVLRSDPRILQAYFGVEDGARRDRGKPERDHQ